MNRGQAARLTKQLRADTDEVLRTTLPLGAPAETQRSTQDSTGGIIIVPPVPRQVERVSPQPRHGLPPRYRLRAVSREPLVVVAGSAADAGRGTVPSVLPDDSLLVEELNDALLVSETPA